MTLRYLLDTNIVVFALRTRAQSLRSRFSATQGMLAVSTITVGELAYGAERSERRDQNHAAVSEFLALLEVLPLDAAAAHHSGRIRAELGMLGTPIGAYDALIAGQARSQGLVVVTNNLREFQRVDGLLVEDWGRG